MIFHTKATQKNVGQKLTDISLVKGKSNELWTELDETSQAAVSGGINTGAPRVGIHVQANTFISKVFFDHNGYF